MACSAGCACPATGAFGYACAIAFEDRTTHQAVAEGQHFEGLFDDGSKPSARQKLVQGVCIASGLIVDLVGNGPEQCSENVVAAAIPDIL